MKKKQGNGYRLKFRVYKTMTTHAWCELESDNKEDAIESAQNMDAWFEDDNDFNNEIEVEEC